MHASAAKMSLLTEMGFPDFHRRGCPQASVKHGVENATSWAAFHGAGIIRGKTAESAVTLR